MRVPTLRRVCQGKHVNITGTRPVDTPGITRLLGALGIVVMGLVVIMTVPTEYVTTVPEPIIATAVYGET